MTRITDFLKGVLSLALIVALLVGIPALLLTIVGFPLPTEVPSLRLIGNHIEDGVIPDLFVVKTLALVVWVVWVQLAVAVLAEVFGLLRGRVSGRAPVLPGIQLFAAKLVASTVLIVSALSPTRAVTAAPILPLDAGLVGPEHFPSGRPMELTGLDDVGANRLSPSIPASDHSPVGPSVRYPANFYATRRGDNWWDIAERLLGDGMRWSELRQLNTGKTTLTGEIITERTETVGAGWHLDVPADADPALLSQSIPIVEPAAIFDRSGVAEPGRAPDGGPDGRAPDGAPDSHARGGLLDAIRPSMLVYEGPTGTTGTTGTTGGEPGVAYQVVEGDNLWDIAERHLGDAFRWPEIFENSTDLQQTFGRRITDPNLIWPDSILWLPGDAVGVPAADPELVGEVIGPLEHVDPTGRAEEPGATAIQPRDLRGITDAARRTASNAGLPAASASSSTAVATETGPVGPVATGAGPDHPGGPDSPGRPDRSEGPDSPGHPDHPEGPDRSESTDRSDGSAAVDGPGRPDGSGGAVGPGSGPDGGSRGAQVAASGGGPDRAETDNQGRHRAVGEPTGPVPIPAGLAFGAGGLLMASGLLGLLVRTRRLRLSEAGPRSRPAPPPLDLVELETVLRNSADGERARSIHRAVQSLGNRSIVVGEPLAAPEVIRVSGDRLEVVQRGADPDLPAPWLPAASPALDGLSDRSLAVLPAASFPVDNDGPDHRSVPDGTDPVQAGSFAPSCVTIGGGLLINLETIGVLGIDGPVEIAAGLVRSMVQELATGPARRSIDLRVSDWLPGADLHEHVRCGSLDTLVGELRPWLEDAELRLAASGGFSAYSLRVANSPEAIPTSTIVFADVADADRLGPLVERAKRHALPLAVVFTGDLTRLPAAPEAVVRLDDDRLTLEPHGFTAAMQYLDVDLIAGAAALVNHARNAPMVLRRLDQPDILAADHETDPAQVPTEETLEQEIVTELPSEEQEITDRSDDENETGMLIRVLGPVEIEGGPTELGEPERSLLTFLALAGPSTAEQLRDAVWPGQGVDDVELDRTIGRLRALLGPRFPDTGDGRHRLRSVVTDLGSARRWIAKAASMGDERGRNLLQLALADVRGQPFAGVSERYWQWTADHKMALATQASSLLIDACFDLCDSAYGANDVHLAVWACETGSLVDPLNETLVTRRVQLLGVLGSADAARRVVDEWEAAYERTASRPAPRGPRMALGGARAAASYVV